MTIKGLRPRRCNLIKKNILLIKLISTVRFLVYLDLLKILLFKLKQSKVAHVN